MCFEAAQDPHETYVKQNNSFFSLTTVLTIDSTGRTYENMIGFHLKLCKQASPQWNPVADSDF